MTTTPPFGNPYGPVSGGPPNPFSAQEGMPAATTGTPLFPEPAAAAPPPAAPSAMRRLGAVVVDLVAVVLAACVLVPVTSSIVDAAMVPDLPTDMDTLNRYTWEEIHDLAARYDDARFNAAVVTAVTAYIESFILVVLFTVVPEHSRGQTLGKRMCGIRVQSVTGTDPSLSQAFRRNTWLLVNYIPVIGPPVSFILGCRAFSTSAKAPGLQGFHDRAADTQVIDIRRTASLQPQE